MLNTVKKSNTITINIKSFSHNILKHYIAAFFLIAKAKIVSIKSQPTKYNTLTVLKSPHKYKKAQEHYQLKIYKSSITIQDINISELLALLSNKPQGVSIKIKLKQVFN